MSDTAAPPSPTADDVPELPMEQPRLRTARLLLRPLTLADAPRVRELAGDFEVASTTLNVPHPYPEGAAERWIAPLGLGWQSGESGVWAIVPRGQEMAGTIGLSFALPHLRAEMGYWVGRPYWGRGYATEAARALLELAFGTLGLERVMARHMTRNPASGAVLRKIGMRHEGTQRQHMRKWGVMEDLEMYGILRAEHTGGR